MQDFTFLSFIFLLLTLRKTRPLRGSLLKVLSLVSCLSLVLFFFTPLSDGFASSDDVKEEKHPIKIGASLKGEQKEKESDKKILSFIPKDPKLQEKMKKRQELVSAMEKAREKGALRFWFKSMGEWEAYYLATYPTLTHLDLANNALATSHLEVLVQSLSLRVLKLFENTVDKEGARILATSTTLKTLDLMRCQIGDEAVNELAKNKTFEELGLHSNHIKGSGVRDLTQMTTLRTLDLSLNALGDEEAKILAQNTTLTKLNLWGNLIGDKGALAFVEKIPPFSLTTLNLDRNDEITSETKNKLTKIYKH